MNFQEKLLETSTMLRARATALASSALDRASAAAKRARLQDSFAALTVAGRELNTVAKRHASRFVKENSAIAIAAGKDLGTLARSTYVALAHRKSEAKARKPRTTTTRKRTAKKAA